MVYYLKAYNMGKIDRNLLNWHIKQLLHLEKDIVIISDGVVTHLEVRGRDFYLYIKSLTYAGKPYPINTTRAQLPKREEFENIKPTDAIFIFLGYDEENKVFACWDPIKTKKRLNEKKYVSFFSRLNLQKSVNPGQIISASLQNDFKYVLFKLNDIAKFLLNINDYFPNLIPLADVAVSSESVLGVLEKVEDDSSVKLLIDESLSNNPDISPLLLISNCMNEFGEYYSKMTLKDWYMVINTYISKRIEEVNSHLEMNGETIDYVGKVAERDSYEERDNSCYKVCEFRLKDIN